ncbi:hypothetical protein FJZ19_03795 [Candidatus Pacearchaeota archaeon]|nr:hypothetical protein [Candidatus Pacearchaeota archaeon]
MTNTGTLYKTFMAYGNEKDVQAANSLRTTRHVHGQGNLVETGLGRWIAIYDSPLTTDAFINKPAEFLRREQARQEIIKYLKLNKSGVSGASNYHLLDCAGRYLDSKELTELAIDVKSRGFSEADVHESLSEAPKRLERFFALEEARGLRDPGRMHSRLNPLTSEKETRIAVETGARIK